MSEASERTAPRTSTTGLLRPPATFKLASTEPIAIDPYRAQDIQGVLVTRALFTGLITLDGDDRLLPGVAHRWSCNVTGTTWRFELRNDVRFSNAETVDAESFVRGITRATEPPMVSETTYHLAGISGFGSGPLAARATDRFTLDIELSSPDFEFDKKTLQQNFSPVPVESGQAENT